MADPGSTEPDAASLRAKGGLTATVIRGVGFAGGGYALSRVLALGSYLVLARLVTPDEFGHFAAGGILVAIGFLVTDSGMLAALIHRRDRIEEAAATAVVSTFAAGLLFGLLALAASPVVGHFFHSGTVTKIAAAMSGVIFLRAMAIVPGAMLQRRFSFLRRVVAEPLAAIAFGVVAVVGTARGMGVWGLVLGTYASVVTDVALSWTLARWKPQMRLASVATWRELVGYGRHVFVATALLNLGDQIPTALIGRFVGAGSLGQFRYAERMAATPFAMMLAAASYVLFPALARIAHDTARFRAALVRALRWMAVVAMPSGLMLIPLGEPGATLVFGERWTRAGQAAMALCVFTAARALVSVVSEGFKADGRPQLLTRLHAWEVGAGAIAMAALLQFGLIGVAIGFSVGSIAGAAYALYRASTVFDIPGRTLAAAVVPQAVCASLSAGAIFLLETFVVDAASHGTVPGLLLLLAEALAGFAIYAVLLRLFAPNLVREFGSLARTARRGNQGEGAGEAEPSAEPFASDPAGDPVTSP